MREERMVLEDVSAAPLLRRHMHAACGIEVDIVIDQNAASVRTSEAGNAVKDQTLAGAARTEERGDFRSGFQVHVQFKGGRILSRWKALHQASIDHLRGLCAYAPLG